MDTSKHIQILQTVYAGALADTVLQMSREGVLDSVTERKKQEQLISGKMRAAQFGITKPEEVFLKLYEIFGCSNWSLTADSDGFIACASACMLCAIAKKLGSPSPCDLYCLNPMEGIVRGIKNNAVFTVEGTLWEGTQCVVRLR
jgi:hypothetical protein